MTLEEFNRICEWDLKCGNNEGTMFQTTVDRRRLIEYVKELQIALAEVHRWDTAESEYPPIFPQLGALLLKDQGQ